MAKLRSALFEARWLVDAMVWELRRIARRWFARLGPALWVMLASGCIALVAGLWYRQGEMRQARAGSQVPAEPAVAHDAARGRDAHALKAFDALLVPHDETPWALQGLIDEAQTAGLTLSRASYESVTDQAGGFRRYVVTFPVQGRSDAVRNFITGALKKQPALALVSANFSRERVDAAEVDARIQFVLLTTLPIDRPDGWLPASRPQQQARP